MATFVPKVGLYLTTRWIEGMLKEEMDFNFQILSKLSVQDGLVLKKTYPLQSYQFVGIGKDKYHSRLIHLILLAWTEFGSWHSFLQGYITG